MQTGMTPNWIDEAEAAEKGAAFLKQWKVIFCPRLTTATPAFQKALEDYAAAGGKLIQSKGDKLLIKGSIVADHDFGDPTKYYLENVKNNDITSPAYRDLSWRKWNNDLAPTFAKDLANWLDEQPYRCSNTEVLLGVHKAGRANYLLFANNAQDKANPRGVKHELIAATTDVRVSSEGVIYDLFNGGSVPVQNGLAKLRLPAGDGACWLHLPAMPGPMKLAAKLAEGNMLRIDLTWGMAGYLPFRLRIVDPSGNKIDELFRATTPGAGATTFQMSYALGLNAAPGTWTVEAHEWLTGSGTQAKVEVQAPANATVARVNSGQVSIYFDDARRIVDLFAGKTMEPDYSKLNWDAKRVFGLDAKKFAVFGPAESAEKIAQELRAKGMTVAVNPTYVIEKFKREPNRGGAGISHGVESNLENIYAHTIVLPGHPLATQSMNRGHINRPLTATFPGPGRAYIQWGIGCYQAGWQNVFILGDVDTGVAWLLDAMKGKAEAPSTAIAAAIKPAQAVKEALPILFTVAREVKVYDTPVGIGTSSDGKRTYVALHDGSVAAYDDAGKQLWNTPALLEGCALAVSPKGDRLAVAGYPGLSILDTADGKLVGSFRTPPVEKGWFFANRLISVAWNSAGTIVAAGWVNSDPKAPLDVVVLDAQGKALPGPKGIAGSVMGVTFVPDSDILLIGADELTAVKATDGSVLWRNPIKGAQAFAFSADGKIGAAGGWGKSAGKFSLSDGKVMQSSSFDSVVGGVALLPTGELAVAVWGGTHPLFVVRGSAQKPEPLFQSSFGFQSVVWSEPHKSLLAAEQGGRMWLLGADGKARAVLSDEAGTTAYRMSLQGPDVLLARMNRVVQKLTVK
jgi:outer membrane protein assembly factor BamB